MAYIVHPDRLNPAGNAAISRPSIWQRMLDAIADSRQQDFERAYTDLIARGGGRLTDDLERQVETHF